MDENIEAIKRFDNIREELRKYDNAGHWLSEAIVPKYKFTILVFYRGSWCKKCSESLDKGSKEEIAKKIQDNGGILLGITSQNTNQVRKQNRNICFPLISDPSNHIARTFDLPISFKTCPIFRRFLSSIGLDEKKVMPENEYEYGIVQPSIVALGNDGKLLYSWKTKASERENWENSKILEVNYVVDLAIGVMDKSRERVVLPENFDDMMKNEPAKELFRAHLVKIFSPEVLEFIEATEELNRLRNEIIQKFIVDNSPMQINIPTEIRNKCKDDQMFFQEEYIEVKRSAMFEYGSFRFLYNNQNK